MAVLKRCLADFSGEGNLLMQPLCTNYEQPLAASAVCSGNCGAQGRGVVGMEPSIGRSFLAVAGFVPRSHRPRCDSSHHVELPMGCITRLQQASCILRSCFTRNPHHTACWLCC